jgi:hypothetical protein
MVQNQYHHEKCRAPPGEGIPRIFRAFFNLLAGQNCLVGDFIQNYFTVRQEEKFLKYPDNHCN